MAKAFDFLGDHKGSFAKQSLIVHCDASGVMQYVGKTQNPVSFSPGIENVEWFDNHGSTQVLYALDIDKADPKITFSFMQISDPNAVAMALNLDMDLSDPNKDYLFGGSNPDAYTECEWRFTGASVDARTLTLVVRRGIAFASGDITLGTPGSYAEIPITIRMLQDTSITNGKRDLYYWMIDKRTFS